MRGKTPNEAAIPRTSASRLHHKDEVLDRLASGFNVAQFVSFGPGSPPSIRHSRIHDYDPNHAFNSTPEAVASLLAASPEGSINVRSFAPDQPKSNEFLYGIRRAEDASAAVHRMAHAGLYTIINETIDVEDGGVSGVAYGGILEFAPGDTPRCVEKPGTVALPFHEGMQILETVYGFRPSLQDYPSTRVEFSIHPFRRGYRHEHTIIWEEEHMPGPALRAQTTWPNLFSRFLGDKAFGLLMAHVIGLPVPATVVVPRRVAPFQFGRATGTGEHWIRTCPTEQVPGRFTTRRGWIDPYLLMSEEDPEGGLIASVLGQEGIEAAYSGAVVSNVDGEVTVEGVSGLGEAFMQGKAPPERLPQEIVKAVVARVEEATSLLGPVRMEWVHDGDEVWVVQLHRGYVPSAGSVIFPGEARTYRRFDVESGLEALRALVLKMKSTDEGITLVGRVGITSHFGDVLRRARIPSRIEAEGDPLIS